MGSMMGCNYPCLISYLGQKQFFCFSWHLESDNMQGLSTTKIPLRVTILMKSSVILLLLVYAPSFTRFKQLIINFFERINLMFFQSNVRLAHYELRDELGSGQYGVVKLGKW